MKLLQYVVYPLVTCFVLFLLFAFVQGSFDPMVWDKKVRALLAWYWVIAYIFTAFIFDLTEGC